MIHLKKQSEIDYLTGTIERHIRIHFHPASVSAYKNSNILYLPYEEILSRTDLQRGTIIIPVLSHADFLLSGSWTLNFRGTEIVLWDLVAPPSSDWTIDDEKSPLWYDNGAGVFMAAWDMVGILFNLLTFKEERLPTKKDKHGRFVGAMSPRLKNSLLDRPIFNDSVALLVDRCCRNTSPKSWQTVLFTKPINICLSHDLDQLRGDDFWTQIARVGRMLRPLKRLKLPHFSQLGFIWENIMNPRKSFMDDLLKMIEVEREYGFRSVQYVLCGSRGRYGARTGSNYIKEYLPEIPSDSEIGIHYNYDTHLNEKEFLNQKTELESIIGQKITSGRAHYLRMDSNLSFKFWDDMGIRLDESLGYPDRVGYRAGIAGSFFPFDQKLLGQLEILSLPLVAMESCIVNTYESSGISEVEKHISHLSIVGGTFSLLFHPGRHDSNEFPATNGMYREILKVFHKYKANSLLPCDILKH